MVTLYDVAKRAKVSIATVSRVLHGQDRVRETTRARVRAAIEELGYVPDGAAQSLARSRKDVVGLVYVAREDPRLGRHELESMSLLFRDEVMRGVESRLRARRWSLLVTYLGDDEASGAVPDGGAPVMPRLLALSGKVDGLLIGDGVVSGGQLAVLARRLPAVLIAGDPGQPYADVVAADNWSGTHALVEHLVTVHGRRRLALVDGPAASPDATVRRRAMEAVIAERPGTALAGTFSGKFSAAGGEQAAGRLLAGAAGAGGQLPDAIVCANDQMAIGVLRRLADSGVRVPRDVAVVGFDDIFPAALCDPPLTTVRQPMRRIGERACERLFARIADPSLPPAAELLPAELVVRASCGCPPVSAR
ncbi:MAG TPA: LacI family DNA-binding transcriptional regulator [Trebonia sp.]|nr:LacI family DNA-binding transcriptional regulator [Trebonia sp.]